MPRKTLKKKNTKVKKTKRNTCIRKSCSNVKKIRGGGNTSIIGTGSFGCAFKVEEKDKKDKIIKVSEYSIDNINELEINKILMEQSKKNVLLNTYLGIMSNYFVFDQKHPNVVIEGDKNIITEEQRLQFITECIDELQHKLSITSNKILPNKILILEMPYYGITLKSYINNLLNNYDKTCDEKLLELIRCINNSLLALKTLHSLNIIHCDFHLENILIDDEGKCRIIDFGKSIYGSFSKSDYSKRLSHLPPDYIFLNGITEPMIKYGMSKLHNFTNQEFKDIKDILVSLKTLEYTIDDFYKIDLYRFGIDLDELLYEPTAFKDSEFVYSVKNFNHCGNFEGYLHFKKILEFIQKIAHLDYEHRELLYEIEIS